MEVRKVNSDNRWLRNREVEFRWTFRQLKVELEQKSANEQQRRDQELSEFKAAISAQFDNQLGEYRLIEVERKTLAEDYKKELAKLKVSRH